MIYQRSQFKSFSDCEKTIHEKLHSLRSFLRISLTPFPDTDSFKKLTFYGDAVVSEKIARNLFFSRRFMGPYLLTQLRSSIIQQKNFVKFYEHVNIGSLLYQPEEEELEQGIQRSLPNPIKKKVICAIVGKLGKALVGSQSLGDLLSTNISTCLEYVISYISYLGEKDFIENRIPSEREKEKNKKQNMKSKMKMKNKGSCAPLKKEFRPSFFVSRETQKKEFINNNDNTVKRVSHVSENKNEKENTKIKKKAALTKKESGIQLNDLNTGPIFFKEEDKEKKSHNPRKNYKHQFYTKNNNWENHDHLNRRGWLSFSPQRQDRDKGGGRRWGRGRGRYRGRGRDRFRNSNRNKTRNRTRFNDLDRGRELKGNQNEKEMRNKIEKTKRAQNKEKAEDNNQKIEKKKGSRENIKKNKDNRRSPIREKKSDLNTKKEIITYKNRVLEDQQTMNKLSKHQAKKQNNQKSQDNKINILNEILNLQTSQKRNLNNNKTTLNNLNENLPINIQKIIKKENVISDLQNLKIIKNIQQEKNKSLIEPKQNCKKNSLWEQFLFDQKLDQTQNLKNNNHNKLNIKSKSPNNSKNVTSNLTLEDMLKLF
ncbi:dicer-related [Anaeramoeba flamelloides]|uniref:Dicer-related n=1 Tax=Anaeramoeba flamelloides TaxID=1746091 RepID=A0ABQ8XV14_9EUKA|nr:dicer-related [Anaeramoeba flamelloides]